jgi:type III restriction enzyme
MSDLFFEKPILNSPYHRPMQHWELDRNGLPTQKIISERRPANFITPIPRPRKQRAIQQTLDIFESAAKNGELSLFINSIRAKVEQWRNLPDKNDWGVTPITKDLLTYWRHHSFSSYRPFFCQLEAVETAIWLAEVALKKDKSFLEALKKSNLEANPEIFRIALKLATGAGKTTVMAMLIAWQTLNAIDAIRYPKTNQFTTGFLIITPGITIRDRLRVLQPNDPENYYKHRKLVPDNKMLEDMGRAKIVITNYHAFKLREKVDIAKGTRALLEGKTGEELKTLETEADMIKRVMSSLKGIKNLLVINDEAHHCYRSKPDEDEINDLKGEEKEEAKKNNEAARLWISGIEAVKRQLGVKTVYDLSATPFFLRGSGYDEGTLFPWVVSDFSLMDAIECGIVKLPRVPVADNLPGGEMPKYRKLWETIRSSMPKKGRGKAGELDPLSLPSELRTALDALYGHYEKTYQQWEEAGIDVPPVFIVVCNNTSTSDLVYKLISGFHRKIETGEKGSFHQDRLALFRNYDDLGDRLSRPRTLLIDSTQLESGDALEGNFRAIAADEIEAFKREMRQRGKVQEAEKVTDQDLLREVMNTVGKRGKLGESIRCVVSVSMLTEGWDANTCTHVLGIRAFGTQLLCEQVMGRALRRLNYELNNEGLFDVEYADILGIPFDFTAQEVSDAKPKKPKKTEQIKAISPERDTVGIQFPRIEGYRIELPNEELTAHFTPDSVLELNPYLVGPCVVSNQGIIGEEVELNVKHLEGMRQSTIIYHLTKHLLYTKYRDPGEDPKLYLFGQLKRIARQWLEGGYLRCTGQTYPAQVLYQEIADMACERIRSAITEACTDGDRPIKAIPDAYNPIGSTAYVNFTTSKTNLWRTDSRRCHVNYVACDSDWEAEFCRVAESHPNVKSYIKNQGLGLEVPYLYGSIQRKYIPDFIVQIDDGHSDSLNLIVEIKGYRGEDAKEKANTMRNYWIPGVNNLGFYGRWAFAEFTEVFEIQSEFNRLIDQFTSVKT